MSVYKVVGVASEIEVFEDKLTITPQGALGFLNHGFKGAKTIPFRSITAIELKQADSMSGYLQFSLLGGNESRGGLFAAIKDENSWVFADKEDNNALAEEIKVYIEKQIENSQNTPAQTGVSSADELTKLAQLRDQGVLSEEEFQAAKEKVLLKF